MSNNEMKMMYGTRLAELRIAADLTTEAIAKRLRIAKTIVTAIESGETHQIPRVFLRGYIVSYAKLVNLPDEELVVYLQEIEETNERRTVIKHYSQIGKQKRYGKRVAIIGFCAVLLLIGIAGFFLWQEHNQSTTGVLGLHLSEKMRADWINP